MNDFFRGRWSAWVVVWVSFFLTARCIAAEPPPADKNLSREAMVRALVQNVIVPGYAGLAAKSRALVDAVEQFNASPDQAGLDRARQAWNATFEAADLMRCFQTGPIVDREFASNFYYWQVIPSRVEGTIKDPAQAIDQAMLDNAGATSKGIYAAEYLLFDRRGGQPGEPPDSARALDLLSASQRRREYLLAVARDVADKAGRISGDWTVAGPEGAAEKFGAAGQASVNVLVNQLTQSIENTFQNHLSFALLLPTPIDRQFNRIKCSRSGTSLQSVILALEGVEKFYRGGNGPGLRDSLNRLDPALAMRVQDKLSAAIAAARKIGVPLERAVVDRRDAIQNAVDETHALEILFKVDLAGALGVTITFTSGDGD